MQGMTPASHTLLLDCLRAGGGACGGGGNVVFAEAGAAANDRHLSEDELRARLPGRARGRVLMWAVGRAAAEVANFGRRPLRVGAGARSEATPDERVLLNVADALARGDREAARGAAEWLVPEWRVDSLLRALDPAVEAMDRERRLRA